MRTTLTLDEDVARLLKEAVHRQRQNLKQVVNEALRRGLDPGAKLPAPPRFQVRPEHSKLRPGLDRGSLNRLADELEEDAAAARLAKRR